MTQRLVLLLTTALLAVACGSDEGPVDPVLDDGCSPIFDQDFFPEYRVTISPEEWSKLQDEFLHRAEREMAGLNPKPYHPIELEFEGEIISDAMIRLKGESSWWQAISLDPNPKMQFVISFNELDKDARFWGVRKIELDMPRTDDSFLRQRLALYALRAAGNNAQCANSARLVVNDAYYGLYTHIERIDKEFLQRLYGEEDEGDLWKGGWLIKTNEDTYSPDRITRLFTAQSMEEMEQLVDVEASLTEWAAEVILPHGDGYYNGRANFYLYDHPTRGFIWIPHDLDSAFNFLPPETSPMFPQCEGRTRRERIHYALMINSASWQQFYVDQIAKQLASYDVNLLERQVSRWAEQIADAAATDPNKPFPAEQHPIAVELLRAYPRERVDAVRTWLQCRENGGEDADGDGYAWCFDCDDRDPAASPDATETCNGVDDDCDGAIDEGLECQ